MKEHSMRNSILALIAVASLVVYVLACATFSPDDSKVLYPTFEAKSGDLAVAVYDRVKGTAETVFVPRFYPETSDRRSEPRLLRPQWLPDGKNILVAWPGGKDAEKDGLALAVLPIAGKGATKLFFLPEAQDSMSRLLAPLTIAGSRVFLVGESNQVLRLDLVTGELAAHTMRNETYLIPDPTGVRVLYLSAVAGETNACQLGQLDPDTFEPRPMLRFNAEAIGEMGFVALSPDGKCVALTQGQDNLLVVRDGQRVALPALADKEEDVRFGNAVFAPKGDVLYASCLRTAANETNTSLGFLEIPLDGGKVRRTQLLVATGKMDDQTAPYFQISLSHDGRTLAVSSTFFGVEDSEHTIKLEDCALFLVDLTSAERKVTRVPVPRSAASREKP